MITKTIMTLGIMASFVIGISFSSVYAGIPWGTDDIADDAITTEKIKDKTIKTKDIRNNQIKSSKIRDETITSDDIATNAVGGAEIAPNAVGSTEILDNSIQAVDLQTNSVGASEIAANAVGASEIATNAVGASEIATNAVGSSEILDGTIIGKDINPTTIIIADQFRVGTDDGTDTDFIYFDSGTSEFLKWDEKALPLNTPAFELSDELDISTESAVQGLLILDKQDGEGTLQRFRLSGTTQGSITVASGTVSYNAFTGSHYAWTDEDLSVGTLVEMTGVNKFRNDDPQNEIIYGVQEASTKNSQAILGTYLGMESGDAGEGTMTPHLVMAEGNGMIWIADTGQDIQPGDYLISSVVPGHAMKDDRSEELSHIIGRAAEPIDWSEVSDTIDGVKHKKISILFNFVPLNNN